MRPSRLLLISLLVTALGASGALAPSAGAKVHRVHKLHITTHVDPAQKSPHRRPRQLVARTSTLATNWPCTAQSADLAPLLSDAPQIKLIYAYPTDVTPNAAILDQMQSDANDVENHVANDSGGAKSVRFDVGGTGGTCTGNSSNYLDIESVPLARPSTAYDEDHAFTYITSELRAKLAPANPHQRVNYVVYADGISFGYVIGQADLLFDTTHGYDNGINQGRDGNGGSFAIVYDPVSLSYDNRLRGFLHEMSHTLGAVQLNAPHSSGAGHCYDAADIMCYDDGGPYFVSGGGTGDLISVCSGYGFSSPLDCNKDDYFNASPTAGSYLATNWNEFDSVFLCPVAQCGNSLTPPTVSLSLTHGNGRVTVTADAGGAPIEHYEWDVNGNGVYELDTGTNPTINPTFLTPFKGAVSVRAVQADGTFGYASVAYTPPDPVPAISARGNFVVGGQVVLDASGTTDPDGFIQRYRWDTDNDGSFESESGLTPSITTSYPVPGPKTAGVEVDYPWGWARSAVNFTIAAPPTPGITPTAGGNLPTKIAAPTISVSMVRLGQLISSGLRMRLKCGAPCLENFTLGVDAATARKIHVRPRKGQLSVIARSHGQFVAGTVRPVLQLTSAARLGIKKLRTLRVTISGSVVQPGSPTLRIKKVLTFRR